MDIGIVVFAYNRSQHLKRVLDGLKENKGVSKLYIFQDGLRCEEHKEEWEKTQTAIREIEWCEVSYQQSPYNKGLAKSIVDGVNTVFRENDAVIVLEDDCVPAPDFFAFMKQCFDKYKDNQKVYTVSGYAWSIHLPQAQYDIYGCGRISSWGWGTWKDRWEQYKVDNDIIRRLKADRDKSRYLALWGTDLERVLLERLQGMNDSWAVYWALHVIEKEGLCINPYKSLIDNIGMDGTGVHCGKTKAFQVAVSDEIKESYMLPEELEIMPTTEKSFADLYGSYTAIHEEKESCKNVLIYGLGNFFKKNEKKLNELFHIKAFIDAKKTGWFAGKKIISINEISSYQYDKIIVMVQKFQECIHISQALLSKGVDAEKIVLGHCCIDAGGYVGEAHILHDGRIQVCFSDASISVSSEDEFNNVCEVFREQIYDYTINNGRRDIVLDVGMNIGDSAMYFAGRNKVDKVFGYEPFETTFIRAVENLRQYLKEGRVSIFQYGISGENAVRWVPFNADMTCGQSTLEDVREYAYDKYRKWGLAQEKNEQAEQIEVKKASEVFAPIMNRYPHHNIVLKMDCEGEEYGILEELLQCGLLERIKFIMLEWHYKGKQPILECLGQAGFSWWCHDKNMELGVIYAYK